jgi:hypothetical protein
MEARLRRKTPVKANLNAPSGATTNTRPALSLAFQRFNALTKSKPNQGTVAGTSVLFAASASVTSRML